jgi:phenylacetate-CoA ligase
MRGVAPTLVPELLLSLRRPFRSRHAIERYQEAALRRLVAHAFDRVPFYRRHFDRHGLAPADVRSLADLARLPPVSRRELQEAARSDRVAAGVDLAHCHRYETSGSSGQPLLIARTPHEDARLFGRRLRAQILCGLRPWDLRVNVGSPRRIFRWHRLGAFRIRTVPNQESLPRILERLTALDPDVLIIAPEDLDLLVVEAAGGAERPAPRHIFTGGNQLRPSIRRRGETLFATRVTDFYGTTECNLVAWQCRRCGRYHTSDDSVIVELLRDDGRAAGPGEQGEVVITTLHSHAMPFVRFRIGDLATRPRDPRECAIRFGSIEHVDGRLVDRVRTPAGAQISPFTIMDALDDLEGLRRWQLQQIAIDRVEVRFEPIDGTAPQLLAGAIARRCADLFGADLAIEVRAVRFDDEAAGGAKLRFVRALGSEH